jgi:predicted O-methyltransferase YrrM
MDPELKAILAELHDHGVSFDAGKADRLDRLRNLEPESAQLLALLVRATQATQLLEIGTSNGYSTLWLADALRTTAGRLTSVEIDGARSIEAARNLERAGLGEFVELRVADAADVLDESEDGFWDMIFLDAERPAYVGYWPEIRRTLKPGGLLAVDNVLSHPDEVAEFRELVSSTPGLSQALVPIGAGVLLVVRNGGAMLDESAG